MLIKLCLVHDGENPQQEDEDTTASRFVEYLLKHLLKGFEAKDKNVRYRVCQIVAELVSSMGEMRSVYLHLLSYLDPNLGLHFSDDLYTALRSALLTRIRDKEAPVRAQVVFALGKLFQAENPDDASEDEQPLLEVLMDVLQYDAARCVYFVIFYKCQSERDLAMYGVRPFSAHRSSRRPWQLFCREHAM